MKHLSIEPFHIVMSELAQSPELVGWRPVSKQFNSAAFFKEDMPAEGYGHMQLFVGGKPKQALVDAFYKDWQQQVENLCLL